MEQCSSRLTAISERPIWRRPSTGITASVRSSTSTGIARWGPTSPYLSNKPNLWKTNAMGVREWFLKRAPVHVTPSFTRNGATSVATATVTGATDPATAIELVLPNWSGPATTGVSVKLNGSPAPTGSWRTTSYGVKVRVGTTVSSVEVTSNSVENWTQTNWAGGAGQNIWADATKYQTGTNVATGVAGQVSLSPSSGGDVTFSDDFTRDPAPPPPDPVPFTWTVPNTTSSGSANGFQTPCRHDGGHAQHCDDERKPVWLCLPGRCCRDHHGRFRRDKDQAPPRR